MKIVVLAGGLSGERNVSLSSGCMVCQALRERGHEAAFVDMYLDVIFSSRGDVRVDDREELDDAHASGELTDAQYALALAESEKILQTRCRNIPATERWCLSILREAMTRLDAPDTLRKNAP